MSLCLPQLWCMYHVSYLWESFLVAVRCCFVTKLDRAKQIQSVNQGKDWCSGDWFCKRHCDQLSMAVKAHLSLHHVTCAAIYRPQAPPPFVDYPLGGVGMMHIPGKIRSVTLDWNVEWIHFKSYPQFVTLNSGRLASVLHKYWMSTFVSDTPCHSRNTNTLVYITEKPPVKYSLNKITRRNPLPPWCWMLYSRYQMSFTCT